MSDERKFLGKISRARVGGGGYQDAMFGVSFTLEGVYSVNDFWGMWGPDISWDKHCKWTESDRQGQIGSAFWRLAQLMKDAKVTDVNKLVGVPVEITTEGGLGGTLKSWRILTEVL